MTMLAVYTDNSGELCKDICTSVIFIMVLLVVLHISGTKHNHTESGLTSS